MLFWFLLLAFGQVVAQRGHPAAFVLPSKEQPGLHVTTYGRGTEWEFFRFLERHPKIRKASSRYDEYQGSWTYFVEFRLTGLGKIEDIHVSANVTDSLQIIIKEVIKSSERYWIPKRINGKPTDAKIVYIKSLLDSSIASDLEAKAKRDRLGFFLNKQDAFKRPLSNEEIQKIQKILYPQYIDYDCIIWIVVLLSEPRMNATYGQEKK
jgi:hypothetical protein